MWAARSEQDPVDRYVDSRRDYLVSGRSGYLAVTKDHLGWSYSGPHLGRRAWTMIGVLPTPQLRTTAFLTVLRAEVTRRSGKDPAP